MLFAGRAIAGLAVGQLTMVVPLYISEVSIPEIRGSSADLWNGNFRNVQRHHHGQLTNSQSSNSSTGELAVVVFVIGSVIQCAAMNISMLFAGRAIAGLAVGQSQE
jgi:predicted MFS family arabinose efflux permease